MAASRGFSHNEVMTGYGESQLPLWGIGIVIQFL